MTAHCYLDDAGPMSSTAKVLEQWVSALLVVVEVPGQTRRERVLDGATQVSVEVWVSGSTGLVPGFACYPSSTIVGSERVAMVVVEKKRLGLSNDEDASGDESGYGDPKRWERDVGSDWGWSKRWTRTAGGCCRRC